MRDLIRRLALRTARATGVAAFSNHRVTDYAERSLMLVGQMAAGQLPRGRQIKNLSEAEFRVFSQWGEDGIIEWLVSQIPVPCSRFVEFGVASFREANCRFLLMHRNWKGLVLDGSEENMARLREEPLHWMYDLTTKPAFVTAENIDGLITDAGFAGPLGILSIDIDGNDYWVWNAIRSVDPAIVVCEYNPIFGDTQAIAVPYDPVFTRFKGHHSGLYFGCSIAALRHLAERKGYKFIGTNSNGINAFFVRRDLADPVLANLQEVRAYPSRHRNSCDETGRLTFAGGLSRLQLIGHLDVENVVDGGRVRLGSIDRPYSDEWLSGMQ